MAWKLNLKRCSVCGIEICNDLYATTNAEYLRVDDAHDKRENKFALIPSEQFVYTYMVFDSKNNDIF